MHADFCVEALKDAFAPLGPPEIMNTDQGSPFIGSASITTLREVGVWISMEGRAGCMDKLFIERFWRSLKREAICLEELTDGFKAQRITSAETASRSGCSVHLHKTRTARALV